MRYTPQSSLSCYKYTPRDSLPLHTILLILLPPHSSLHRQSSFSSLFFFLPYPIPAMSGGGHQFHSLRDILRIPSSPPPQRSTRLGYQSSITTSTETNTSSQPKSNTTFPSYSSDSPPTSSYPSSVSSAHASADLSNPSSIATDGKSDISENETVTKQPCAAGGRPILFGTSSTTKSGQKLFPPPISCLKKFKTGKPFKYLQYNEEEDNFDMEEIRIPTEGILRASREGGQLRLYLAEDDSSDERETQRGRRD